MGSSSEAVVPLSRPRGPGWLGRTAALRTTSARAERAERCSRGTRFADVAQNMYDDEAFFVAYSGLRRSVEGLDGAPEWPTLRAMLPAMPGRRVVDLGCGYGWFSRWAADAGAATVLGIDLSERMLERATADTCDDRITYQRRDLDVLELPDAAFDVAYSSLALHYLADLGRILATIYRSLIPGGVFVFSIEHPIYSAPSRPDFIRDSSGHVSWPLDQYQIEGPRTTDWLAPGVQKYHRTIGTYVSGLLMAGFTLDDLCEWAPSAEQIAEFPEWSVELERPQFLLIGTHRG
jgi:SAM-dependent methyltransferase